MSNVNKQYLIGKSITKYLFTRYLASILVVAILTSIAISTVLNNAQKEIIALNLDKTEDFLRNAIYHEVRNYEIESLRKSLESYREILKFKRIEVIGSYGRAISDVGNSIGDLAPNSESQITDTTGAVVGVMRIWYSDEQGSWGKQNDNAKQKAFFLAILVFCFFVGGLAILFRQLIETQVRGSFAALSAHMNTSMATKTLDNIKLLDQSDTVVSNLKQLPAHSISSFREVNELARTYSNLENRWVNAVKSKLATANKLDNQYRILLNVLDVSSISIASINSFGHLEMHGVALPKEIEELIIESQLDTRKLQKSHKSLEIVKRKVDLSNDVNLPKATFQIVAHDKKLWTLHVLKTNGLPTAILRDITLERALEDALVKSETLKSVGQLSSSIAHDFNNVLATILANMEIFKNLIEAGEEVPEELIDGISTIVAGVTGRISGLRRLALNEVGELSTIDQNKRIQEIAHYVAPTLGTEIKLKCDFQTKNMILCDSGEFESAILNVLLNSKDAMQGKGRINITTRVAKAFELENNNLAKGEYVAIDITDSGPGIAKEFAGKIFDAFFTTKNSELGTGLGLAQVQAFCLRAGGGIYFNQDVAKGACITFLLPLSKNYIGESRNKHRKRETAKRNFSVIILDDNQDLSKGLSMLLKINNIHSQTYSTLRELKKDLPSLDSSFVLLSDVHMPDCVPQDVIESLENLNSPIGLAFYSGNEESLAHIRKKYPQYSTIQKPLKTEILIELLESVLLTTTRN